MSWSKKYKKSIDCSNPKGFSQKAHCAGRKSRQSGKDTKSKSVNEMKLSQLKEQIRSVIRERFISESSYKLGSEQYTKKTLSPTEIHSLANEYLNTSVNKMYGSGKKMDTLVNVANDLARLLGTTQQSHTKRGNPALLLQLLKNNLVDKNEYVKLYRELIKKQESVIKTLKNADPASRMVGGAAARQAYKDMKGEFEESVDEAITNPKKSNPNDLAKTVIDWYDFATDYIDDGGQRRRAEKSNDDVVKWFDSHPSDVKQKAFKVMLSKQPSIKSKIERIFGSKLKESANKPKTYKKGDKLKIKLPNGKKFDVVFDMYARTKGVALGKFKDSHGEYDIKPFNLDTIVESVINEDTRRVKLLGIDFKVSEMNGRIFFSFVDKKAASVSLRQVGTNKIVNHIQNKLDIAYGKGTFFFKSGDHAEFQNGYLFQRNTPDINLNKLKSETVNEAIEPEIISQLKDIVKNKQYQNVKDPKTGKKMKVDMQTANAVLQIYNGLSNVNKDNMVKMGLPKMIDVSFKIINKYK